MEERPSSTLPPGAVVAGKYQVVSKLGDGGMSVVYEAIHQRLQQRVALKMLRPSLVVHPELVERFEREARAVAHIDSPNVAMVMDLDSTLDGIPYMVLEFLQGHDLAAELAQNGRLPIEEAVGYVMTACAPLAQAHALGIVHRDLKPSNLFLARKGEHQMLKVLDFGIAKVLGEGNAKITSSMFWLGTPHYMSPEQIRGSSNVDGRTDLWSLGIILYELLTGTVPFPDAPVAAIAAIAADPIVPPRRLREEIPAELEAVIMRALAKDRDERYQTARELATALAPFSGEEELVAVSPPDAMPRFRLTDPSELAPPMSKPSPVRERASTARSLVKRIGGVGALLVAGIGSTVVWASWKHEPPAPAPAHRAPPRSEPPPIIAPTASIAPVAPILAPSPAPLPLTRDKDRTRAEPTARSTPSPSTPAAPSATSTNPLTL